MAISHVQQFGVFASGNPSSVVSNSVTVTSGNALICGLFLLGTSVTTITVSDTLSNTWATAIGPFNGTVGGAAGELFVIYVKKLNASGSTAVTVNFNIQNPSSARLHCHEVSGLDQTSPLDQINTNTATSASMTSGNVATLFANEFLYGYGVDNAGNPTTGVGWTPGITEGSELDEWQIVSSTGTYAATYTGDGASYMCEIATFKGAAVIPPPSSVYSVPDCRVAPAGPNANRTVQATKIYDVQTSSNHIIPPTDSRVAANIPVDSRVAANIPQNSRTPGTYGPGVN